VHRQVPTKQKEMKEKKKKKKDVSFRGNKRDNARRDAQRDFFLKR
jgi:hypothetical protein